MVQFEHKDASVMAVHLLPGYTVYHIPNNVFGMQGIYSTKIF